jgi:hypothetical protein
MKVLSAVNNAHKGIFTQFFKRSIPSDLQLKLLEFKEGSDGNYMGNGYLLALQKKLEFVLEYIQKNTGEIFIVSDVDIVFGGEVSEEIKKQIAGKDIVWQNEKDGTSLINGGFCAIFATEKTERLYKILIEEIKKGREHDQDFLNKNLQSFDWLQWGVLPSNLFSSATNGGLRKESLMFHANNTCKNSVDAKTKKLTHALGVLGTHITVASYKEDFAWVRELPFKHTVYNTANNKSADICVENIGRESSQYLYSIISRYGKFSPFEVFCQADPFFHCRDFSQKLIQGQHVNHCWFPLGAKIRGFDASHKHDLWARQFAIEFLGGWPGWGNWVCGAQFSVTAEKLMSHPKEYYEALLQKVLSETDTSAWAIERLWSILL